MGSPTVPSEKRPANRPRTDPRSSANGQKTKTSKFFSAHLSLAYVRVGSSCFRFGAASLRCHFCDKFETLRHERAGGRFLRLPHGDGAILSKKTMPSTRAAKFLPSRVRVYARFLIATPAQKFFSEKSRFVSVLTF